MSVSGSGIGYNIGVNADGRKSIQLMSFESSRIIFKLGSSPASALLHPKVFFQLVGHGTLTYDLLAKANKRLVYL
jgi:hypothetical protein